MHHAAAGRAVPEREDAMRHLLTVLTEFAGFVGFAGLMGLLALTLGTSGASAGWRDDLKVLKVGFIAGDNPAQEVARLEKFRWQLQYALAVPVELFPARSYRALIEAESSGRIQYAVLSALAFVALDRACHCAEPLVQPVDAGAASGFRALIVARTDGRVTSLDDARGMRLAIGRSDSLSARLVPFAGLAATGIVPERHFAALVESADALEALTLLADGEADLAVAWSTAADPLNGPHGSGPIAALAARGGLPPGGLRVLWQSDLVPFGPHAVRSDLPPEAKAALRDALLAMHSDAPDAYDAVEPQFAGGFVAADPAAYRRLGRLLADTAQRQ